MKDDRISDCPFVGSVDECTGVFNAQVTKTTGMWVSNAWVQLSAFALSGNVADHGKGQYCHDNGRCSLNIAAWRCDRSRDHMDRDQKCGALGPARSALFIVVLSLLWRI